MSKHTEKWTVLKDGLTVVDETGAPVAECCEEKDALLIAAAPEMLDRLTECLGYLEASHAPEYFIDEVRKTIAKGK
jgi:hypothetical protein